MIGIELDKICFIILKARQLNVKEDAGLDDPIGSNMSDEERQALRDKIQARFRELNGDLEAKLKKVLLPHQFERLKQIELQSRIQQGGAAALTSGELADALDLTDEQRDKLAERADDPSEEVRRRVQWIFGAQADVPRSLRMRVAAAPARRAVD